MQQQTEPDIYLASRSPRRRELLDQIGVRFAPIDPGIDETLVDGEGPEVFVLRMALEKARSGFGALGDRAARPVLGADTVVILDDEILGKPRDEEHGLEMLRLLSGATHTVLTAVALVGEQEASRLSVSSVTFRALSRSECAAYWASGEPRDKAGAYAIQGRGAVFVEHLAGSYSGVMGLPLYECAQLFDAFGVRYWRE